VASRMGVRAPESGADSAAFCINIPFEISCYIQR